MQREVPLQVVSFATELGWMALVGSDAGLRQIVIGHASEPAALRALDAALLDHDANGSRAWRDVVERLKKYASGKRVEFDDVLLDLSHLSEFQRLVTRNCRTIRYGQTQSYKGLAAASGSPRAARAVGNTMAANRFPIIVPCHRVINADGSLGSYSAPGGPKTKARLLALEATSTTRRPVSRKVRQPLAALVED